MLGPPSELSDGPPYTELIPRPDPSKLTDAAIERSTTGYRRELDALRQLLAERIVNEAELRDRSVIALRDVLTRRMDDLDQQIFRRFGLSDQLPEQIARSQKADLDALRQLIETRLTAMDTATELVARDMLRVPNVMTERLSGLQSLIGERIDGIDKATALLAVNVSRMPSETDKAVAGLRELLGERIDGMDVATKLLAGNVSTVPENIEKSAAALKAIIETRLAGMDEATKLLASNVDKVPYAILQEAGNLKALILSKIEDVAHVSSEKFLAVESTFASNALALTAALAAQEKAVAEQNKSNTLAITKSEITTKETIAANAAQTQTGLRGLEATFADLKERVVRIESTGVGAAANQATVTGASQHDATFDQTARLAAASQQRATISSIVAGIAVLVAVIAIIVPLILRK